MYREEIIKVLLRFYEFIASLNKPIFGKPLFEWFKLAFIYSFIIWFPIMGWKFYNYYSQFKILKEKEKQVLVLRRIKENQLKKYFFKLNDIKVAYEQVSKYFSKANVKKLMEKVNRKILLYERRRQKEEIYNPVAIELINFNRFVNFSRKIYIYLPKYDLITLNNLNSNFIIVNFFKSIDYFYDFYRKNYNKKIAGKVDVSLIGKRIILYFNPDGSSILSIKPIMFNGLIQNLDRILVIPTYSFFFSKENQESRFSNIFFGWSFVLKEEAKNE